MRRKHSGTLLFESNNFYMLIGITGTLTIRKTLKEKEKILDQISFEKNLDIWLSSGHNLRRVRNVLTHSPYSHMLFDWHTHAITIFILTWRYQPASHAILSLWHVFSSLFLEFVSFILFLTLSLSILMLWGFAEKQNTW